MLARKGIPLNQLLAKLVKPKPVKKQPLVSTYAEARKAVNAK